jgi:LmbE family N-acetylglucosaminyl deacetylase
VLALSPHTDDIELGCGGYLTKLHEAGHEIDVVAFSDGNQEGILCEYQASLGLINACSLWSPIFPVRSLALYRKDILDYLVKLTHDLVLIPSVSDVHQDHRVIHEEGVRAFSKRCRVLAYELPWNCRSFTPNYFVSLQYKHVHGKMKMLECYESQKNREYFDLNFIEGLARMRGQQIKTQFAEAFEVITWID